MSPPPRPPPRAPRRPQRKRKQKPLILVVGEGQCTEFNYFAALRSSDHAPKHVRLRPIRGKGGSALQTVKLAIKKRNAERAFNRAFGDHIYCIIDVESPDESISNQLTQAIALAKEENIRIFLSNPSFEVWLLAHYGRLKKQFTTPDDACRELETQSGRTKDDFNRDHNLMQNLVRNVKSAIANAKKRREQDFGAVDNITEANSTTDVYLLVEYLLELRGDAP